MIDAMRSLLALMKTAEPVHHRFILAELLTALFAMSCGAYEGCPWKSASAVTVQPATDCISASVIAARNATGSCVKPGLRVHNGCSSDLTLSGVNTLGPGETEVTDAPSPSSVVIPTGGNGSVEVEFTEAGGPTSVSARLGTTPVTLTFTLTN